MYISMKVLRILFALLFAAILLVNYNISHNNNIPGNVQKKIGNVSFVILIIMVTLGSCYGILESD